MCYIDCDFVARVEERPRPGRTRFSMEERKVRRVTS